LTRAGAAESKAGGGAAKVMLDEALVVSPYPRQDRVALKNALEALAKFDDRKSRVKNYGFWWAERRQDRLCCHVSADAVKLRGGCEGVGVVRNEEWLIISTMTKRCESGEAGANT
jgi:hypothetical protein